MKHRLLKRQIKKHLNNDLLNSGVLDSFLTAIDTAYKNFDADYQQLERTLEISSKESFKELSDLKYAISQTTMVMVTDYKGKINFVNDQFCKYSGFQKDELLGKMAFEFNSKFQSSEFYKKLNETITKGHIWKGEIKEINKSGDPYWVDTTIVPMLNSAGKPIKYYTFKVDISKIKKAEEESEKALKLAENALKIKAEFLSNMSHEIRTPMNAIMGLSDIILQKKLEYSVEDNVKSIKQSADNLLVIINDILDFSKIEAGKVKIENISFNFFYQMEHIKKTMSFKAEKKNLKFLLNVNPEIPKYLRGDPYRLNQVILNLCGNAIKFTQEGKVSIDVDLIKKDKNKVSVYFAVIDTGIGISKDRQAEVFNSFTQADVKVTRQFGGTGLGLTITKQLIALMGGQVYVESKLGKGSKFYFNLEFEIPDQTERSNDNNIVLEEEKCLKGLQILVLEDNLINQKVISQILHSWDCDFYLAENGFKGINKLKNNKIDIILMDLQMPQLDGFETTKAIRTGSAGIHYLKIPIIALTADAFPETKKKVLEIGMNDLVSKPFNKTILNSKIYNLALEYCPEKLEILK